MLFPCWPYPYCTGVSRNPAILPQIRLQFPFSTKIGLPQSTSSISLSHLPQKISTQTILTNTSTQTHFQEYFSSRSLFVAFHVSQVLDCSSTNDPLHLMRDRFDPLSSAPGQCSLFITNDHYRSIINIHRVVYILLWSHRLLWVALRWLYTTSCFQATYKSLAVNKPSRLFSLFRISNTTNNGLNFSTASSSASRYFYYHCVQVMGVLWAEARQDRFENADNVYKKGL